MTKTKEIKISARDYARIQDYLDGRERLPPDRAITYTARFDGGYEMDVKCCGSDEDCAWTEAVLFKNGGEVCCTEPEEEYLGEWALFADGTTFITEVSVAPDERDPEDAESLNLWFVSAIFRKMLQVLPAEPGGHFWAHENKIMCDTAARAAAIADFLNALCRASVASAGYFDPAGDKADGLEDMLTGWHYVWLRGTKK